MVILLTESTAMIVMVAILAFRMRHNQLGNRADGDQNWKALRQLLPLSAYPILFCIFTILAFINRVYGAASPAGNHGLSVASALSGAGWSLSTGATLLTHILVVTLCSKRHRRTQLERDSIVDEEEPVTIKKETDTMPKSYTTYVFPTESVCKNDN